MNKKLLKQLMLASYREGSLDQQNILTIADRLTRAELKHYIKALKQAEKAKTVVIDTPFSDIPKDSLQPVFPNKKLLLRKDSSLLLGIRVTNNDDIFEMSLKHELDDIIRQVSE